MKVQAAKPVTQISNLLYRRLAACERAERPSAFKFSARRADCKSAIQQIGNLRYGCALESVS